MGLFVNTNVASLIARNTLFDASEVLTVSYERLSSGLRVNRAADDAAGSSANGVPSSGAQQGGGAMQTTA